ncbi:MAG TPA: DUF4349 domain-containing protein [Candidatus Limiplasma sp.]|nr:DUF4349 domain-containing protein [Candidatus Limiplasma sp.]
MRKNKPQDALDHALTDLYQTDVPAGYRAAWRNTVKREEPFIMKPAHTPLWLKRTVLPMAAALVLIVGTLITGALSPTTTITSPSTDAAPAAGTYKTLGIAEDTDSTYDSVLADYGYVPSPETMSATSSVAAYTQTEEATYDIAYNTAATADTEGTADTRKIVRTVDLTITTTDYEQDYAAILALAESAGGYAASVSASEAKVQNRSASFDLRIPSDALDDCLSGLEQIGRITDRYESATDLTTQYSDTQLRLETQQSKMTRLQTLLTQAETVEDLLAIENEIADTQYQIDSLESSLRSIDRQVDYSTVYIYLREQTSADTANTVELSIGERIRGGLQASLAWLGDFFANMLVFLIAISPVLAGGFVLYLVIHILRKHKKSGKSS